MKISDEFMVMRRTADITQVGLAKMLGVSQQTICNWEVGHTTIPAWAWVKVQELSKEKRTFAWDEGVDFSKLGEPIDEAKHRALLERLRK